ncbi:MAG: flavodoxin domain-containing protein [Tissierellales bacterium]|jgi:flavodoxin|nr:flavodoxin domain-containing protein [Tissierellales bacterium]HCX03370.1 nitric oxide synthase [Clostridiales bacterium]
MNILILYDSFFGNTEKIAQYIKESIEDKHDVKMIKAGDFEEADFAKVECLIIGTPTRAFRPTKDISNILNKYPLTIKDLKVAAFDTRIDYDTIKPKTLSMVMKRSGYAVDKIYKKLSKIGVELIAEPAGFYVGESEGPLLEGEKEKAERWLMGKF